MPPEPLADFMVERGYVGRDVPLLKRVVGLPGQRVCRTGHAVTVDGGEMGEALERDRIGRELHVWQRCRVIGVGQIFLLNWQRSEKRSVGKECVSQCRSRWSQYN